MLVLICGYSWSFVVIRGHSWSFLVTRGHSWSFVVIRVHSWSFVVTRGHSGSLVCTFRQDLILYLLVLQICCAEQLLMFNQNVFEISSVGRSTGTYTYKSVNCVNV